MTKFLDFILLLLSQFAGGPGPRENNLMRFGLPALLWGALLVVAWLRQRQHDLPREKLLVWGFGLGLARELFMFSHVAMQFLGMTAEGWGGFFIEPLEHSLTMAAIVVVAGAFLRYILNDVRLSRRYLWAGLVVTGLCTLGTTLWWSQYSVANPESRFNQTCGGVYFHATTAVFMGYAIFLLARKRGWLRNVVSLALIFFFLSGVIKLFNFATSRVYTRALCPISNSLHILAIPLLGYVYLREQAIEKEQAEQELKAYRDHLEELVTDRTTELTKANEQLQWEIAERKQAELEIARRSGQLAAQNAIAATISRSLDLDTVLNTALDTVLAVLEVEVGSVYLFEPDGQTLALQVHRGRMPAGELAEIAKQGCPCMGICLQAVTEMKPVVADVSNFPVEHQNRFVLEEGIDTLLSTPLVSKGRAVGALTLGARRPNVIQAQDLDILTAIGQQIGMAVENARLYRETERWAEELALLHQVSIFLTSTLDPATIYEQITEQAAKLLGCQVAIILQWHEEWQEAVGVASYGLDEPGAKRLRLRPGESDLLLDLITRRQSIVVKDVQSDPRLPPLWQEQFKIKACLCLPVWGAGKSLALLFLIDRQGPRQWRADEVALIESFVNRAAIALENAHLHKQLEWAAALEERQRIAAEMHDGLAQTLSLMGLRTDRAAGLVGDGHGQEAVDELHRVRDAINRASQEVRRSIASLQETPPPRRPLQDLLTELLDRFTIRAGPSVSLVDRLRTPLFLPPHHEEQVLPVVQEALLNARRHAQARQITVLLEEQAEEVTVVVEDDGRGFDPNAPRQDAEGHFGLSIMRARAARVGGRLQVVSTPGQGTRVILTWPLTAETNNVPLAPDRRSFAQEDLESEV